MSWLSLVLRSALLGFLMAVGALTVQAVEAQELPPFPYLYGGVALVDGAPAASGAVLTVRVGDWSNGVTIQQGGAYANLMVAPPDKSYYLKPITFELNGMTAQEEDVFLPGAGPTFKDRGYVLHFVSQTDVTATPTVVPSPAVALNTPTALPATVEPTATSLVEVRSDAPVWGLSVGSLALVGLVLVVLSLTVGGVVFVGLAVVWNSRRRRR